MSYTTDESDNRMRPKGRINSPSVDEGSSGGSMRGVVLKKGPWTSAEDAILVEYVKKYGEGNWNAVQRNSGLLRCGKSCRLRWANHLRPNLKKGAFTPEEEQKIVELHAQMGNKWARMAAQLPGRTDNEIKNYWNTRIKRRRRAGLPLYPSNMSSQASGETLQGRNAGKLNDDGKQHNELLPGKGYEFSVSICDDFVANPGVSYLPHYPDIPQFSNNMLGAQEFGPQTFGHMNPMMNCFYQHREFETMMPNLKGSYVGGMSMFESISDQPREGIHGTSVLLLDIDHGNKFLAPVGGAISGCHGLPNGNFSTSETLPGSSKLELPSLQYPDTVISSWPVCPSTPPEAVNSYDPSHATISMQSDAESPRKSGLLEALLYEAQTLLPEKNQQSEKSSSSSVISPNDVLDDICHDDWEDFDDPISPLACSAASVFTDYTPIDSSPLDGFLPSNEPSGSGAMVPTEEHVSTANVGDKGKSSETVSPCPDFLRPDALLGSSWLAENTPTANDHSALNDAIATLLGGDLCTKYEHSPAGASSTFAHLGLDSYSWNSMPRVCQLFDFP